MIFITWICFLFQNSPFMPQLNYLQRAKQAYHFKKITTVCVLDSSEISIEATDRLSQRILKRFQLNLTRVPQKDSLNADILIRVLGSVPSRVEDRFDSYQIRISKKQIEILAESPFAVLYAYETLLQGIVSEAKQKSFPYSLIKDKAAFPWRGLLIDVSRHFIPKDVMFRNMNAMVTAKLNVLHLHLSDDQGFRMESKRHERLHLMASNGEYFTQKEMKEIIDYAYKRGIRVVPEFDLPGHSSSWITAYPHLSSKDSSYSIEKGFGVFDPTIDPTKESSYEFLSSFLTEMAELFPDPYIHIGGDENNGLHWSKNDSIQAFMRRKGMKDQHDLQAYFNQRLLKILEANSKQMMGWDEILHDSLPQSILIQSWRGRNAMVEAAKKGYRSILSNGYYIDLAWRADRHYQNRIITDDMNLNESEKQLILGGEATMWSELVTAENIDSRIWPRSLAIAERLWSQVTDRADDVADMYRRLLIQSANLEEHGLRHRSYVNDYLKHISGLKNSDDVKILHQYIRPLANYERHSQGIKYSTDLDMKRWPDAAEVESEALIRLDLAIQSYKSHKNVKDKQVILSHFQAIYNAYKRIEKIAETNSALQEIKPLYHILYQLADFILSAEKMTPEKKENYYYESMRKMEHFGIKKVESEVGILQMTRLYMIAEIRYK